MRLLAASILSLAVILIAEAASATTLSDIEREMEYRGKRATRVMGRTVVGLTADKLIRAYKSNEVSADAAVKDRIVWVCGVLRKVQKAIDGKPQSIIDPFDDSLWPGTVVCNFEGGYEDVVGELQAGNVVATMGICEGAALLDSVTISGCGPYYREYAKKLPDFEQQEAALNKEQSRKREAQHAAELQRLADEKRKKRPAAAAAKLKLAKKLKYAGKDEGYRKWLKQIVDQYPETDAVTEARELLSDD